MKDYKITHLKDLILSISEYSILIRKTDLEDYKKIGSSRICGYPDLPLEIKFPVILENEDAEFFNTPKLFALQINLEEMPMIDKLPNTGMLYFFIGSQICSQTNSEIIYYPNKLEKIQDLKDKIEPYFYGEDIYNKGYKLNFEKVLTIPSRYTEIVKNLKLSEEDSWNYSSLDSEYESFLTDDNELELPNVMFGYYPYTDSGFDLEDYYNSMSKVKSEEMNWKLILGFRADDEIGTFFNGGGGSFNFLIRDNDLKNMDFSHISTEIESS